MGELLAYLGNFINRALKFTKDNFGSKVPEMNLNKEDWELVARVNQELTAYISHLEDAREREAITAVFNVSRLGNQLMQHNTPWKLVKGSVEDKARAGTVVGLSVNMAALLSVLIQPYMPNMAVNLEGQLAVPKGRLSRLPTALHCILPAGHTIGAPSALVEQLKAKYQGKQSERGSPPKTDEAVVPAKADAGTIADLEAQVAVQGNKVREVKASKAEKSLVEAEVKLLLELKQKLSAAQGTPAAAEGKGKKGKKK